MTDPVKTIAATRVAGPEAPERFKRGIALPRKLLHSNIVRCESTFEVTATLDRSGSMPAGVVSILRQAASALSALHAKGSV